MGTDTVKVKNISNITKISRVMLVINPVEEPSGNFRIKKKITKIKTLINGLKNRMVSTEERICVLEDKTIK